FRDHLPRLREMGVDILWLMPIFPVGEKNRKGTLGSYYAVRDYKAINPEFGTMDDFKELMKEAHAQGFKVILDWVANHTSWDNQWIYDHPEWYTLDSLGKMVAPFDWTDVADLNYDDAGLRDAMIDALKFWIHETDVDGYRCDVAGMVPIDFWDRVRKELDSIKPVFMLAEAEQADLHFNAFDMTYAWELHHILNSIAQGKMNANAIDDYFQKMDTTYPVNAYRMNFITNHDENSWNGTVKERMADASDVMAMLTYTLPGMPLLYSGQEVGLDKRLEFFEKDTIWWNTESPLLDFYTQMIAIKHKNEALWNGEFGSDYLNIPTDAEEQVLAFTRKKKDDMIIVLANLSDRAVAFNFTDRDYNKKYIDLLTGEKVNLKHRDPITMEPWSYLILGRN
ncbi:MAG: alpha-glucosidase C-terminal domain-containing protein, partial [Bacteroidales bacterium]|nr:alpha-glucosidase C-terminal domain-containing protein [Bacteroidales bacterium]